MFQATFKQLSGKRFDPYHYYQGTYNLNQSNYKVCSLREFVHLDKGQSITKEKIIDGIIPVIAGGQTSPYKHKNSNFNGNVITISASGAYAGFVCYHDEPIFASDCNVLYSRNEIICTTEFLGWFLKAIQSEVYKLQQGAAQPHVYGTDLGKLQIPLPPLEKQKEIGKEANRRRFEAQQLSIEADMVLEDARLEVEEMILKK